MQFNQINEYQTSANYFVTPYRSVRGVLSLGDRGLYFNRELTRQSIRVPYEQISAVWVQLVFQRIPYGIIVETATDALQFRFWHVRGALHVFNRKLPAGLVRHQRRK
ncbi:hypothetical protein [Secundilactobacillus folii]|uniref:GRAM domain-containing protein n=1 Tax=Secundilactobacillus folii TaxID=2678357 RepID=A0A7X3C3C1_9LACO|nr:hypothetical protein [Secundilactobacillus folii]MTV82367.1 hypothetical protein [Secundilactobacillus folii]